MHSFADFKKKQDDLNNKLLNEAENDGKQGKKETDDRFWYPSTDKAGNGFHIIRFLPAPPGEDLPYTKLISHGFKHPSTGRWYIENSLRTLNQSDPVATMNAELWNTDIDENKEQARNQKQKPNYFFNVYIVKDSINPENEGKVKILKGGPWVWNHIKTKLFPEFEGEETVPVFDFWKGADFRIKIYKKGENRQYDRCAFDAPSEFMGGDEKKLEEVWNQQFSLQQFIEPDQFKTFEELEKRLNFVLGLTDKPERGEAKKPARQQEEKEKEPEREEHTPPTEDDDDDIDFFKRLAEDDDVPF